MNKNLCKLFSLMLLTIWFTGCGDSNSKPSAPVIRFEFNSADGIYQGHRVVYIGTMVGKVTETPSIQPDGKSVIVTAELDALPGHLLHRLDRGTTAKVDKTDMVMGEKVLTLYLSQRLDNPPLPAEDSPLPGMNNQLELQVWKQIHQNPDTTWWRQLAGLVFPMNADKIGQGLVIFNLICFAALLLVVISMLLDGFHKLISGEKRIEKGSPALLRGAWKLFAALSILRILLLLAGVVLAIVGQGLPSYPPYVILPDNPVTLLQWEWPFLVAFIVVVSLKFKLRLFMLPLRFLS